MKKVYTLGTSTRSLDEFLGLLRKHGIERIIDVRRFPTSRYEHFKKERLEKLNIKYIHLEALGGYRGGYEKYMAIKDFKKAFKGLLALVKKERCAIICAELLYYRCHRRYISDALARRGVEVVHIIDEKRSLSHKLKD